MDSEDDDFVNFGESLHNLFREIHVSNNKGKNKDAKHSNNYNWRNKNSETVHVQQDKSKKFNNELNYNWRTTKSVNSHSEENRKTWKWNEKLNLNDSTTNSAEYKNIKHYQEYNQKDSEKYKLKRNNKNTTDSEVHITLDEILNLKDKIPENVILSLVDKLVSFKKVIGGKLSREDIVLLLRVFAKICASHLDENRGKLIKCIVNGKFLENILQYLQLLATQNSVDKLINKSFWSNPNDFWDNLLILYENIYEFIPNTACEIMPKIVKATILSITDLEACQNIKISNDVKDKLEKFQLLLKTANEKKTIENSIIEEPPNDFRFLSIYPSVKDVTNREVPFIRPIITNGVYQSVDHYLDVQFRLLKEDFTASLRNGICSYLEKSDEKQFDVRIYENVKFVMPYVSHDRVGIVLQYTNTINKKTIEESSRRFIYGSLLCLTLDNFKSFLLGTIINSDIDFLRKGQIIIDVIKGYPEFNKKYTMVECTVFFEPYSQVLQALQKINEKNFPFKDYIINITSEIKPPKYITKTTIAQFMENCYRFRILSPETWPKPHQVGLNESQFKAFYLALTQEFSIIQGPPGTGKTYTTLRIVEFLIRNKDYLRYRGPILVICFTNHALDQFLEGILLYTKHILRVGGQSKNEEMKQYGLQKYRQILTKITRYHTYSNANSRFRRRMREITLTDEEKYFLDYHSCSVGRTEYHCYKDNMKFYQNVLTQIISNDGIINFHHKMKEFLKDTWFDRKSNKQITDWLLECNEEIQKIDEPVNQDIEDSDIYFDEHELHAERIVIDDDFDEEDFYQYSITPGYLNDIISELSDSLNEKEKATEDYVKCEKHIQEYVKKRNYLIMRLQQSKTTEVENPPNTTKSPEEMSPDERWQFYRFFLYELKIKVFQKIFELDLEFRESYRAYQEISQIRDNYIMNKMKVIGMTTTGAAKHQKILRRLQCPIVIAEEAAEVLESHIIASVPESCQHLVLIGDHKQLRPNTAQYELAKKYNLEISLFERMIKNGIHCQQLNTQHRMRPEFAELITPAIYSELRNNDNVLKYPNISGLNKNLYFINHSVYEDYVPNSSSHKNIFEAKYLIGLACYFIKQGYSSSEITILTTYKGQMYTLKEEQIQYPNKSVRDIRITVVDNFQGEENKIILLSLVRSNQNANIGFLKTENRVCVALSRAKEGFYIIGNMNNLEQNNTIWPKVKKVLQNQNAIGDSLTVQCQIHLTETEIKTWEDFSQVSEGGCKLLCNTKLDCGHICNLFCHPYDTTHEEYKCTEKCTKFCKRNHPCKNLCYQKCSDCIVLIKTKLNCGHVQSIPCWVEPEDYNCNAKVNIVLSCGHIEKKKCFMDSRIIKCSTICDEVLDCGHKCKSKCHDKSKHVFIFCTEPCLKLKKGCSTNEHKCDLLCCDTCNSCTEMIEKRRTTCTHKVTIPCSEDADGTICKEKCRKMLPCNHFCPKLCYEECGGCLVKNCGETVATNNKIEEMNEDECTEILKCGHKCINKKNEPCVVECREFITYNSELGLMVTNYCYKHQEIINN